MIPYKDDNPTRTYPIITVLLIVINTGVWIFFRVQGELVYERAVFEFGMIPWEIFHRTNLPFREFAGQYMNYYGQLPGYPAAIPPLLTFFSSMFMHGGFMHLAGNMLYLWIFGNNVEDYLGHIRFTIYYLVCGLGAAAAHLLFNAGSQIPTVGASGAISGVLAAYLLLYPAARVHVLIPVFYYITTATIPAAVMIVFWFFFQVIATLSGGSGGEGVAYWAHIGGFIVGLGWIYLRRRRRPPRRYYRPGF